jgi:hypothetical protein
MIHKPAIALALTVISMMVLDAPLYVAIVPITLNLVVFLYSLKDVEIGAVRIPGIRNIHDKVYTLKGLDPRE